MTIRDFERWGTVRYGTCLPPPTPLPASALRSVPPLVSCPAGMLAKLIGLLQIRRRHCSRNISPFSLCSRSPGPLKGIEALRTQHKSHFLLYSPVPLIFFPSSLIKFLTLFFLNKCETFQTHFI